MLAEGVRWRFHRPGKVTESVSAGSTSQRALAKYLDSPIDAPAPAKLALGEGQPDLGASERGSEGEVLRGRQSLTGKARCSATAKM